MEIIDWIMRFIIHVDTGSSDQLGDSLQAFEELFGIGEGLNGTVQLFDQQQTCVFDFSNVRLGFALSCMRCDLLGKFFAEVDDLCLHDDAG